jgi:hypothetical protein
VSLLLKSSLSFGQFLLVFCGVSLCCGGTFFHQAHASSALARALASDQSLMGASSLAAGSAAVATPEAEDVGTVNPALVSRIKGYYIGLGSSWLGGTEPARGYRLALLENRPDTVIPTSVVYAERFQPAGHRVQHLRLAVGNNISSFLQGRWSWGLALSFHRWPDFESVLVEKKEDYAARFGLHYLWYESLSVGAFAESSSLGGVGISWIVSPLARLRLEWLEGGRAGFEFYLNSWLIASMGYQELIKSGSSAWSWGLKFAGPRLNLAYSWSHQSAFYSEGPAAWQTSGEWWHRFDMGLIFW